MNTVEILYDEAQLGAAVGVVSAMLAIPLKEIFGEPLLIQLSITRARFLAQTAPDGSIWLESAAAKRRRATGRGGGTLFDTGRLFHSLQATIDRVTQDSIEGSVGTDVPYSKKHQEGVPNTPIVKREFLGWAEKDVEIAFLQVTNGVERWINDLN